MEASNRSQSTDTVGTAPSYQCQGRHAKIPIPQDSVSIQNHECNPSFMEPLVKVQAAAPIQRKPYPCHQCPCGISALQQGTVSSSSLSQASSKAFQHPAAFTDSGQAGEGSTCLTGTRPDVTMPSTCHACFQVLSLMKWTGLIPGIRIAAN